MKNYRKQTFVSSQVADQIRQGESAIVGIMLESNLYEGRQDVLEQGPDCLKQGVSITDACIGWETTESILRNLASAVRERRIRRTASQI